MQAILLMVISVAFAADATWKGQVPALAQDSKAWEALTQSLRASKMPYGAMAASARMLTYFSDLQSKESAYRTIIELIDQGYPFSRTELGALFTPGDLEAQGDVNFVNSYNLSKYLINHEKGMERWAQEYYRKMNGDGYARYQYYVAIEAYAQGKLDAAVMALRKILAADTGTGSGALAISSARLLARIYFEEKKYASSLDIYTSLLLRLNPVTPSDWLEAAWNQYYLKNHAEALGLLYNLESRIIGQTVSLEKYTLRALIYRENCAVDSAQALTQSMEREFGDALKALKQGESPATLPVLSRVQATSGSPYQHLLSTLERLRQEAKRAQDDLPQPQRGLAQYLYDSEISMLEIQGKAGLEIASQQAAKQLVLLSEQLKFLKYDVAREKYDPDRVFQTVARETLAKADLSDGFQVRWPSLGDFWRNERLQFKGVLARQCE